MVHRQRGKALLHRGDGGQRHDAAVAAGEADILQRRQARRRLGILLEHHAILIRLSVNSGDQPLAEGVVQRVIDIGHRDAEAAGAVPVHLDIGGQAFVLPVAADVGQLRLGLQAAEQRRHPGAQRLEGVCLQGELILGAAHRGVDGQVLGRLQVERHARDAVHRLLQAAYHRLDAVVAFIQRLEVDLQAGAVQRRVGAVDADEGGQTLHRRILKDNAGHLPLALGHAGEGDRLRRLEGALDNAVILDREKAFRDKDPQDNRQRQGAQGDAERQPRMVQHPAQPAAIDGDHPFEETLAGPRESVLLTQRFVA